MNLKTREFLRGELDLRFGEKSSGSSAAAHLTVRVASTVHRILILAVIAERISLV